MSDNPIEKFVESFEKLIRAVVAEQFVKKGLVASQKDDHYEEDIRKARKEIADGLANADQ